MAARDAFLAAIAAAAPLRVLGQPEAYLIAFVRPPAPPPPPHAHAPLLRARQGRP
jgi:hypothetical protein